MEQIKQLPVAKDKKQELINKVLIMTQLAKAVIKEVKAKCELGEDADYFNKIEGWIDEWINVSSELSDLDNRNFEDRIAPIVNSFDLLDQICSQTTFKNQQFGTKFRSPDLEMLNELYRDFIAAKKNTFNPPKKTPNPPS